MSVTHSPSSVRARDRATYACNDAASEASGEHVLKAHLAVFKDAREVDLKIVQCHALALVDGYGPGQRKGYLQRVNKRNLIVGIDVTVSLDIRTFAVKPWS